jgi:hypothetical protein
LLKEEVPMARKTTLKVILYDDSTYEISRGTDCDDEDVKGKMKKKKKKKKKPS